MDAEITIRESIKGEMSNFNASLVAALETNSLLLKQVIAFFLKTKGKQIRPILVILSAKLFGNISEATINAAVAIELLHNASLIHDDVIDESDLRRGKKTVNNIWDNRVAVLVGDFFVSCALKSAINSGNKEIIDTIANLGKELAAGEVEQIETARGHLIDKEKYFHVIEQKTASLFSSCMRMGGLSNGATESELSILSKFGEKLGLCFQIKDDIFDYFESDKIGKPTGSDLKEGKVSLPLIYAIKNGNGDKNDYMRALLSKDMLSDSDIETLVGYAKSEGGIEYAVSVMEDLKKEARDIISYFGRNAVTDSLENILQFTTVRNC